MPGWPKLPSSLIQKALNAHLLLGLVSSAALYLVSMTGTAAVFSHELHRWETPAAPVIHTVSAEDIRHALEEISELSDGVTQRVNIFLPTDESPHLKVTSGQSVLVLDTDGTATNQSKASWSEFVVRLHSELNLPRILGLAVVGLLGVLMLASSITGFISHPRVFRDAFLLRLSGNKRLQQADIHNRLSVWTSPFHITIALSGAVLGLCTIVAVVLAPLDHGGNSSAVFQAVFGPGPSNASPGSSDAIIKSYTWFRSEYPDMEPNIVTLDRHGPDQQTIQITARHPRRLISGEYYYFRGDGIFAGSAHMSDGYLGPQLISSLYRLHFGTFGGLWLKWIYGLLGSLLSLIIASGMNIYLMKRQANAGPAPKLEALWISIVWGTPASLALGILAGQIGSPSATVFTIQFWSALIAMSIAATCGWLARPGFQLRILTFFAVGSGVCMHLFKNSQQFGTQPSLLTSCVLVAVALCFLAPEILIRIGRLQEKQNVPDQ